jgi:hypothetical protein
VFCVGQSGTGTGFFLGTLSSRISIMLHTHLHLNTSLTFTRRSGQNLGTFKQAMLCRILGSNGEKRTLALFLVFRGLILCAEITEVYFVKQTTLKVYCLGKMRNSLMPM